MKYIFASVVAFSITLGYLVEAKDLREGDVFLGANGELSTLVATERVVFPEGIRVYNFTVDGTHDYFVIAAVDEFGQTCVLVHNGDCVRVTSNIKAHPGLVRHAEIAGKSVQKDLDHLVAQLQKGNMNPGIGTKPLFGGIFEARSANGARVYFRNVGDGIVVVGKSNKTNQPQVIKCLQILYGN